MRVPRTRWPLVCAFAGMALGGCSVTDVSLPWPGSAPAPLELPTSDPASTPDQQQLVPRIEAIFKELKLESTPEISRLRRAPTIASTDWMFCLRGITEGR